MSSSHDNTAIPTQHRVEQLQRQHLTDQETIAQLEEHRNIDRDIIAQLRADGVLDQAKIANLEVALVTCRRIGSAIGILMTTHKITDDAAFDILRTASQRGHRKLRDIADLVVTTGTIDT